MSYIASISLRFGGESIIKDVTKKLNKTPNLTIEQLINSLIKDEGNFNEEEKEIMNYIKFDMQRRKESGWHRFRLGVKALNESGEYRTFPTNDGDNITKINRTEIAKNYFEPRKIEGTSYKGLDLEVYARG